MLQRRGFCYAARIVPESTAPQSSAEKRRLERIRLYSPLHALISGERATLVDVSPIGARIEHATPLPIGAAVEITLRHEDRVVALSGTVVRCRLDRSLARDAIIYDTGIDFSGAPQEARASLRELIGAIARLDLDARRKYARGRKK